MATVQRAKAPATTKTNGGSATTTASPALTANAIAQRAYEIWKESGCPNGADQEHWFRAERELRGKLPLR